MSVFCDVCWIVLGKTGDSLRNMHIVGIWKLCPVCYNKVCDQIFEWVKSKEFKKN